MRIFISHKKEDESVARRVMKVFESVGVDAYLDVLDNMLTNNGEELTKHIRQKLRECSEIIVILSSNTKHSWWVPFEIGMATEKEMSIVNYLVSDEILPEYLSYWPRLKCDQDVLKYVEIRKQFNKKVLYERSRGYFQKIDCGMTETERFYAELKKHL